MTGLPPGLLDARRHPDLFAPGEACDYLRLPDVCGSMEAARNRLNQLCRQGRIRPLDWGKTRLFCRAELDRYVASQIAEISPASATQAESNGHS